MTERRKTRDGYSRGFTLIELMMVLAVLAVMLLVAAPGLQELIRNNRQVSELYTLRASLANARSEAVSQRESVTVCPINAGGACAGGTDWSLGYKSFINDPNDPFQVVDREVSEMEVSFDGGNQVVFNSRGNALGSAGGFVICDTRGPEFARGLILAAVGSLRSAVDDNGNGIVNVHPSGTTFTDVIDGDCP